MPRFARCAVRQCARHHGTSPSLSGCAPVARLRALGKHFRSSFDSSAGCFLAPPVQLGGEEETLGLSWESGEGGLEAWEAERGEGLAAGRSKETVVTGGDCSAAVKVDWEGEM